MKATEDIELILAGERVMRSLIVDWCVSPDRTRMEIILKNPSRKLRITGADNVTQAILELNYDPTE